MPPKTDYSYISSFRMLFQRFPKGKKRSFGLLLSGMIFLALIETAAVCVIAFFASAISDPGGVVTSKYITFARSVIDFQLLSSTQGIIVSAAILTIVIVVFKNIVHGIVSFFRARFSADMEAYFGEILLRGFLEQPYEWHISQNSADLINSILWRKYMGQHFIIPYLQVFNDIFMMLAMLIVLFVVQPMVSLIVTIVIGSAAMIVYKNIRTRIDRMAQAAMNHDLIINKETTKAIHGIKDIKISLTHNAFVKRFSHRAQALAPIIGKQICFGELPVLLLESIGFILLGVTVCFLLLWTSNSTAIVTGTMALIAVVAWRTLPALSRVVGSISKIRNALPYLNRQLEYLEQIERMNERQEDRFERGSENIEFIHAIRFDKVCFGYKGSENRILNFLDFKIQKGSTIGIVGGSGAGKSTLVDLLTGLLNASEGKIFIDNVPLTGKNYRGWGSKIGYVSQSPYIYDGTLAENIAYGLPYDEIDMGHVSRCATMAAMDDFLRNLPDHLDSCIGERGVKLSGGQRQRVAIARALYTNPEVMIFDEATSSLDSKNESEIMKTIYSFKGKLTLIVIAHRLSTVEHCDELIWIEEGGIKMIGTPDKVLKMYGDSNYQEIVP